MDYFLDFEFMEDGRTIEPLSIGLVASDGREYYAEFREADRSKANDFVKKHVLPQMWRFGADRVVANQWSRDHDNVGGLISAKRIATEIRIFCQDNPRFWGYYSDYDWVAMCQLFGTMMDLPEGWPKYCLDLKQWAMHLGNPKLPEQTEMEHFALADARWNREVYDFLVSYARVYYRWMWPMPYHLDSV